MGPRNPWRGGGAGRYRDVFGYTIAGLGGGMASIVGWLSFVAPDTVEGLRADIDRAGLTLRVAVDLVEPVAPPSVPQAPPVLLVASAAPAPPIPVPAAPAEIPAEAPVMARPGLSPTPAVPPASDVALASAFMEPATPVRPTLTAAAAPPLPRLDQLVPAAGPIAPKRPGVSVVIQLFGADDADMARIDDRFPAVVAVALSPYLANLEDHVEAVQRSGRRALIEAPIAADGETDGGPLALASTDIEATELALARIASRAPDADAVLAAGDATMDLLAAAFSAGVPLVAAETLVGEPPTPAAIDEALAQVEFDARLDGHAVAVVRATPMTLDRVARWAAGLDARGIALVEAPIPSRSQFGARPDP